MDPRMRSLWIETFIFVIIPTIIFKLKIMVIEDIYNPMVDILLVIIVAELFRLLYKFRKLRLEGVDIDSEAGARPSSSSSDPKLNDVLSKQNRIVYLFEWVVGIFGICIALVAVIF
ncbi:MAG: hypothetical protein WCO09_05220, partial [bacterium]